MGVRGQHLKGSNSRVGAGVGQSIIKYSSTPGTGSSLVPRCSAVKEEETSIHAKVLQKELAHLINPTRILVVAGKWNRLGNNLPNPKAYILQNTLHSGVNVWLSANVGIEVSHE
jgi:hypothetical protein